ncbi:MAB_1171c family putative transporter [Streptomyces silvensis]|uniref:DUF6545 domain-containing protein n=1 Tax=Streptomyces silvensis TaxID=1765722 RepID=A0A0W7X792_9ACTN|nr:MAB_1171c family putative transporter [Streptomyces silvensis]KUF18789.1 hypothetical protein AT728_07030 [Streptomyces silvensis]
MYYTAFFVVLAVATVWKIHQLRRRPENRPLRWLTLCTGCAAMSMAMPGATESMDGVLGTGAAKLMLNALTLGMTYSLMVFFLCSADDGPATRRRVRAEGAVLLGVLGFLALDALTAPGHAVLHSTFEDADMTVPQVAAFYLCVGLYMLHTLAVAGRRTHRYARRSSGPEAIGLWITTGGIAGLFVSTGWRAGFVAVRIWGVAVPRWLTLGTGILLAVGYPVFVLGVTWPGARSRIAAGRLWFRHRRTYRQLEPLWRLLSSAYPDTVLPDARRGRRTVHRRYARRVVECRDGLVRISPRLRSGGPAPECLTTADLAARLRQAAEAARGGGQAEPRPGTPLAVSPGGDDREAEVQHLVALSLALRALPEGA